MKKSVIFLVNGLGIERKNSYSIAIEEAMPNLSKLKETSFFTTAITDSIDVDDCYQRFFLGDTSLAEINYLKKYVMNDSLKDNPSYSLFKLTNSNKYHIFMEPTSDKIVDFINLFIETLGLAEDKKIYLHLIMSQQSIKEYPRILSIINYIKFHLDSHITVGFVMGRDYFENNFDKKHMDHAKQMFFACSCERWRETEKKIELLQEKQVCPCDVEGFCTTNECFIENHDTILFFNTRRENYDSIISTIYDNARVLIPDLDLPCFSFVRLNTKYAISYFVDNVDYENSLSNILLRNDKKMLIVEEANYINLVNFYANGFNSISNPIICFLQKSNSLFQKEYINYLIQDTPYDVILFDFHMDTSSTVNHLKEELSKIDIILGHVMDACENRHSLFVTSLYGLHKRMPLADYNPEMVTINYEMQIPIFFFDYFYPASKYDLFPGETYDILCSALRCVTDDPKLDSIIRDKTFIGSLIKTIIK